MVPDEPPLTGSKDIYLVMFIEGSYPDPNCGLLIFFLPGFTAPDCEITGQPDTRYQFQMWRVTPSSFCNSHTCNSFVFTASHSGLQPFFKTTVLLPLLCCLRVVSACFGLFLYKNTCKTAPEIMKPLKPLDKKI